MSAWQDAPDAPGLWWVCRDGDRTWCRRCGADWSCANSACEIGHALRVPDGGWTVTRVLLVTGARSLAAIPGAEAWARGHIRAALDGVALLIVGDAAGPDAWAADEHGGGARRPLRVWHVMGRHSGWITVGDGVRLMRWTPPHTSTHPLRRNEAMVQECAGLARDGYDVRCLALLDGTKRDAPGKRATRGTEHTAALAERAGIVVTRRTWPETEGR